MSRMFYRPTNRFLLTTGFLFFALTPLLSQNGISQLSTTVSVPSPSTLGSNGGGRVLVAQSPNVSRWEKVLGQSHNDVIVGSMRGEELVAALNEIGVPVSLDPSAYEDEFDDETEVTIPDRPGTPLYRRLNTALKKFDAVVTFANNQPVIVSLSYEGSPEFFHTATYNVTSLSVDRESLISSIQTSIDGDSWRDTGTGEGVVEPLLVNGQRLLIVSQTYENHLQIREFFRQVTSTRLPTSALPSSTPAVGNESRLMPNRQFIGARAVQLPSRSPVRVPRTNQTGRSLRGGGGVFNIYSGN